MFHGFGFHGAFFFALDAVALLAGRAAAVRNCRTISGRVNT
jgi:hypothetical protein